MPTAITLNDAIEEFLASRKSKGLADNTIRGDRASLHFLLKTVGNIQLRALEPRHIDMVFTAQDGNMDSSRNMLLTRMRVFFQWARGRGYMKTDPTMEMRRVKEQRDNRLFVPVEEFDNLLDAATHPRDRIVVALGMYLFLRVSEIESLRVGDVDLAEGEVKVKVHKTKDRDIMPICQELDEELRRWLTWYAANVGTPLEDDMYLVPAKRDYRAVPGDDGKFRPVDDETPLRVKINPYTPISRPYKVVQRALGKLGYPTKREGGHTLRRSGARALFDTIRGTEGSDGALQQVKVMLHHKNVSMTEHYLGIQPERAQRDARLKGKRMFARPQQPANVVPMRRNEWPSSLS